MPHLNGNKVYIKDPITDLLRNLVLHCQVNKLELVIGCDSNAHNKLWGDKITDERGCKMLDFMNISNLTWLNRGCNPTFRSGSNESVIDLTLATPTIEKLVTNWKVDDKDSYSDHMIIEFCINSSATPPAEGIIKKRTDWIKYKCKVKALLNNFPSEISTPKDLDQSAQKLRDSIMKAYEESCRIMKTKIRYHMEWFNNKLHNERTALRKLFSQVKVMKTSSSVRGSQLNEQYKQKRDTYKKLCQRTKNEAWFKKMESLENTKDIARLQRLLETSKPPEIGSLITKNGKYTSNNEETIQELMSVHFPDCRRLNDTHDEATFTPTVINNLSNSDIEDTFKEEKINWAIHSLSPFKSPGEDGIFPALLQKASDIITPILAVLFKASAKLSYIPTTWRGTFVTFIPKAEKATYNKAKSYRPISLMSFILKVLEKLFDRRIREKDLIIKPLHPSQNAYTRGKGPESALHYLITEIEKNTRNEDCCLVAFIDIEGAFDHTSFETIRKSATDKNIDSWIVNWIAAMLKSRNIKASMAGSNVVYNPTQGCLQGGCISPLLWCLVVDSLIKELTARGFKVSAFADDLHSYYCFGQEKIYEYAKRPTQLCALNCRKLVQGKWTKC